MFISFKSKIYNTSLLDFRLLNFFFSFPAPQITVFCVTDIIF